MNKANETEQHNVFLAAYKKAKRKSKRGDLLKILAGIILFLIIAIPLLIGFMFIIGLFTLQSIFYTNNNY